MNLKILAIILTIISAYATYKYNNIYVIDGFENPTQYKIFSISIYTMQLTVYTQDFIFKLTKKLANPIAQNYLVNLQAKFFML